jgi:carboxyl-terminal processing protease
MTSRIQQLLMGLALAAAPAGAAVTNVVVAPEYSQVAARLVRLLPREHLSHHPVDNTLSARTWTNYLEMLDFERVYFLASDIAAFKAREMTLDDELKEGDVRFAFEVFETFKRRVEDRARFVEGVLRKGFDLTKDETYVWRRRKLPWPADQAEWDELWRKRVKNEYVRETVGRELAKAAARAAATNAAAAGTNAVVRLGTHAVSGATNASVAAATAPASHSLPPLPPIEQVLTNQYRHILTVFRDNDAEWVLQRYLSAFAHAYDPHSDYMSPSAVQDFDIEMKLSLVGIGALLRPEDGAAKIVRLIPGGPADRDKRDIRLRPGDRIVAVAQGDEPAVDIRHWPLYKAVNIIRGKKGTKVVLTVLPAADPAGMTTRAVDLVRDEVKLEDQAAKLRIEEVKRPDGPTRKLAAISVPAFYANMRVTSKDSPEYRSAAQDVKDLLAQAAQKGAEGVLLNLRGNGGGSLLEAVLMTGLFIEAGPTVQVQESRGISILPDRDPAVVFSGPLVVLVNRLSASASEILAGALQDYGRAVIVGDSKTHGKGTVQAIRPLGLDPKLGQAKTTGSVFYRISGGSTQLRGVTPDVVLPSPLDFMEVGEEHLPNPLQWSAVEPAPFARIADLNPAIATLREKSAKRRQADTRFDAYGKWLERVKTLSDSNTLTLRLEERIKLAQMERELAELQRTLGTEDDDGEEPNTPTAKLDLVLEEGLRILADLVDLQAQPKAALAQTEKP